MAQVPSFLSGSRLTIRINQDVVAYAQNLTFSDDMRVMPVGGIGAYSFHTLEPTDYIGRGSMSITHYSDKVLKVLKSQNDLSTLPDNLKNTSTPADGDGNSFLRQNFFNPINLITSLSFTIDVHERDRTAGVTTGEFNNLSRVIYRLKNCRLSTYSIGFSPGSMVTENVSFLCTSVEDTRNELEKKRNNQIKLSNN